jgi:signal transduction histidine kinase
MAARRDPSKFLQVGFVGLLLVLLVLACYWIYDHVQYAQAVHSELGALYQSRADSTLLAKLDRDTNMRINRVLWEGAFFLAVLLGGLTIMTRTIRHDAELRRRQQNFLAAVSHEFKSPLASIRLAAETLVMRSHSKDVEQLGRRILADDERLLRMVDNLLNTARLEEGAHPLAPERTALAPVVARAIDGVAEQAARTGIAIEATVGSDLELSADANALETILRNLLDNAINACSAGDGKRIDVRAERNHGRIELAVIDDGAGFPPDDAELIFEKFYRAGDEMRRTTPGTGLGLYIVRRLAELSGATITASSAGPGRGARLDLSWPAGDPT